MKMHRILLVDDDPHVTKLLRLTLEGRGNMEVAEVADGRAALLRAKEFRPDLIVCDIDLGATDGGEVAHRLAADPATAAIPLLYLSSLVTPADAERQLSGGRRLISKQQPFAQIVERILRELPG